MWTKLLDLIDEVRSFNTFSCLVSYIIECSRTLHLMNFLVENKWNCNRKIVLLVESELFSGKWTFIWNTSWNLHIKCIHWSLKLICYGKKMSKVVFAECGANRSYGNRVLNDATWLVAFFMIFAYSIYLSKLKDILLFRSHF